MFTIITNELINVIERNGTNKPELRQNLIMKELNKTIECTTISTNELISEQ